MTIFEYLPKPASYCLHRCIYRWVNRRTCILNVLFFCLCFRSSFINTVCKKISKSRLRFPLPLFFFLKNRASQKKYLLAKRKEAVIAVAYNSSFFLDLLFIFLPSFSCQIDSSRMVRGFFFSSSQALLFLPFLKNSNNNERNKNKSYYLELIKTC